MAINDINKGLDGTAKEKLKKLYDQNNQMFDGTAKLAFKDFDVKSNQSPALTKGGQVTDLKSAEPATPKLNTVSEFSLAKSSTSLTSTLPLKIVYMKASAAGADPAVDCEGTIQAWAMTNPEYAATCKCSNGPNALPVCGGGTGTDTWQKLKDKLNSIIKAIRGKIDAVAIALWGKELGSQNIDATAWIECDGEDNFRVAFPNDNKVKTLAVCRLYWAVQKHEAAHYQDNIANYPDRCKGQPAGTADLWSDTAAHRKFKRKSECRAYLDVTIPQERRFAGFGTLRLALLHR